MSIVHCPDCDQTFDSDEDVGLVIGEKWICSPCKEYAFCNRQLMVDAEKAINSLNRGRLGGFAEIFQKLLDQSASQNEILVEMYEGIQDAEAELKRITL